MAKVALFDKMMANINKPQTDDRLAILAVEIGLAGGEVLSRDFGFTTEQVTRWLDAMLDQAKANRVRGLAHLAIKKIDSEK